MRGCTIIFTSPQQKNYDSVWKQAEGRSKRYFMPVWSEEEVLNHWKAGGILQICKEEADVKKAYSMIGGSVRYLHKLLVAVAENKTTLEEEAKQMIRDCVVKCTFEDLCQAADSGGADMDAQNNRSKMSRVLHIHSDAKFQTPNVKLIESEVVLNILCDQLAEKQRLQLTREALFSKLNKELRVQDELSGGKHRVLLTLAPEQVCHRLLWALGDSMPAELGLQDTTRRLQIKFPQSRIRCSDSVLWPGGVLRTLFALCSLLLLLGLRALTLAAWAVHQAEPPKKRKLELNGPSWEELLDQLSARIILTSALAYFWLLYGIAAAFPLRSLHSPFQRDLGCLAAYSHTGTRFFRLVLPLAACGVPAAMAVAGGAEGERKGPARFSKGEQKICLDLACLYLAMTGLQAGMALWEMCSAGA
ncbi:unnamed protein product [Effrenium voratum]|nr:unnamed protein product [Effrenium voratum]